MHAWWKFCWLRTNGVSSPPTMIGSGSDVSPTDTSTGVCSDKALELSSPDACTSTCETNARIRVQRSTVNNGLSTMLSL